MLGCYASVGCSLSLGKKGIDFRHRVGVAACRYGLSKFQNKNAGVAHRFYEALPL